MKGTAKIYYKQSQYIREAHREILNYEPPTPPVNVTQYSHHLPPTPPPSGIPTTVELHPNDASNEMFAIPPSSALNDQSTLDF